METMEIEESIYQKTTEIDKELKIQLKITGLEPPKIQILKNKREFTNYNFQDNVLTISKPGEIPDNGCYEFIATNSVGRATLKINIRIKDKKSKPPTRPSPPPPPIILTPQPDLSVNISWSPPHDDGGSPITKYLIEKFHDNQWQRVSEVAMEINSYTIGNLEESTEYTFRISAENKIGKSEWTTSEGYKAVVLGVVVPPPRPPFEILAMTQNSFTLRWKPAEEKVSGYLVEKREEGKKAWQECGRSLGWGESWVDVGGLKGGVGYFFRVCSLGVGGGVSEWVGVREEAVKIGGVVSKFFLFLWLLKFILFKKINFLAAPSPPQNLQILTITSKSVTIQWSPPKSTGGAQLTSYIVEKLVSMEKWEKIVTLETSVTQFTITNLVNKEWQFRVFAENPIGLSQPAFTECCQLKSHASELSWILFYVKIWRANFSANFCVKCFGTPKFVPISLPIFGVPKLLPIFWRAVKFPWK